MARCRCAKQACNCALTAGDGLSLTGLGSAENPFRLTLLPLASDGLTDIDQTSRQDGYVLAWDETARSHRYQPAQTAAPGLILANAGVTGDGSSTDPLRLRTSGSWGDGPLAGHGTDDTVGQPVYVDSQGDVRAAPFPPTYGQMRDAAAGA